MIKSLVNVIVLLVTTDHDVSSGVQNIVLEALVPKITHTVIRVRRAILVIDVNKDVLKIVPHQEDVPRIQVNVHVKLDSTVSIVHVTVLLDVLVVHVTR